MSEAVTENEIDELERFLRSKWIENSKPVSVLADEDRAIAEKLLGKEQAEQLAATNRGERFRYRPERITKVEYFYVPPDRDLIAKSGWTIELYVKGAKRVFARGLDDPFCAFVIKEMTARQYSCRLVRTEAMRRYGITSPMDKPRRTPRREAQTIEPRRPPAVPQRQRSKRFAIMEELRNFRR
ncbi:MAG TPA: hypothetical protein VL147_01580 [Devosia sp.]|nr:hypothetical protein [Devosia sp.]